MLIVILANKTIDLNSKIQKQTKDGTVVAVNAFAAESAYQEYINRGDIAAQVMNLDDRVSITVNNAPFTRGQTFYITVIKLQKGDYTRTYDFDQDGNITSVNYTLTNPQ